MANIYNRQNVLETLVEMAKSVCDEVYVSTRPQSKKTGTDFIVVRLNTINPYADTHNIAIAQINCFTKDRDGGVEAADRLESMIDGVTSMIPFDNSVMSCNENPSILPSVSDGMGYHAVIIQFKIIIKL